MVATRRTDKSRSLDAESATRDLLVDHVLGQVRRMLILAKIIREPFLGTIRA